MRASGGVGGQRVIRVAGWLAGWAGGGTCGVSSLAHMVPLRHTRCAPARPPGQPATHLERAANVELEVQHIQQRPFGDEHLLPQGLVQRLAGGGGAGQGGAGRGREGQGRGRVGGFRQATHRAGVQVGASEAHCPASVPPRPAGVRSTFCPVPSAAHPVLAEPPRLVPVAQLAAGDEHIPHALGGVLHLASQVQAGHADQLQAARRSSQGAGAGGGWVGAACCIQPPLR